MQKEVNIFDNGHYLCSVEVTSEPESLISVFEIEGIERKGNNLCILLVADMDYAIVIPKDVYDRINASLNQTEENYECNKG